MTETPQIQTPTYTGPCRRAPLVLSMGLHEAKSLQFFHKNALAHLKAAVTQLEQVATDIAASRRDLDQLSAQLTRIHNDLTQWSDWFDTHSQISERR